MAWFFYDSNGNLLQVTGAHTLASHTGTLAITAGGTGATSATAAASALGVGTEDSPEFTGINVGHASDTTITKHSTGNIAVEGSLIYRAGGTDVPLTDGGTGASSASAAATALGLGTGDSPTFTNVTASTAFVPDASDGAALGTTALEFSDLFLADAAVINLGADQDVTFTHVHNTGVLLNSTSKIQFGDAGTFIHQSADGVLTIESDTTVDINGAVVFGGALSGITTLVTTGTTTFNGVAYTWPGSDVAGSLRSDGSGALTWTAVAAGVGLGLVIALGG